MTQKAWKCLLDDAHTHRKSLLKSVQIAGGVDIRFLASCEPAINYFSINTKKSS